MSHTPEDWKFYADTRLGPSGNVHYYDWIIESDSRKLMAVLSVPEINKNKKWREEYPNKVREHEETLLEVEANAKRIVACVNACKGINPEVIPDLIKIVELHVNQCSEWASRMASMCDMEDSEAYKRDSLMSRSVLERLKLDKPAK